MRNAQVWNVAAEPQQRKEQLQPDLAAAAAAEQFGHERGRVAGKGPGDELQPDRGAASGAHGGALCGLQRSVRRAGGGSWGLHRRHSRVANLGSNTDMLLSYLNVGVP